MKAHSSALVDPKATIAEDVEIGPFCVIGPKVTIGAGTKLLNHVTLMGTVTLGKNNLVYPYAVLGGAPQDLKYKGEEASALIGDNNILREYVTVNIGTTGGGGVTRIGNNCMLMAASHVAHDCEIGNNVVLANQVLLGGHVKIEDSVGVSAYVGLHHFVTVGKHAFIGGLTRISIDTPPFMISNGIPQAVVSPNFVGLKRRGFNEETLLGLKEAHRLLWRSGLPKPEALGLIEQRYPNNADIKYLLDFMKSIAGGRNGRSREAPKHGASAEPETESTE